jgi:hypothetical protein
MYHCNTSCNFRNYYQGYDIQSTQKFIFEITESETDFPFKIFPQWRHVLKIGETIFLKEKRFL